MFLSESPKKKEQFCSVSTKSSKKAFRATPKDLQVYEAIEFFKKHLIKLENKHKKNTKKEPVFSKRKKFGLAAQNLSLSPPVKSTSRQVFSYVPSMPCIGFSKTAKGYSGVPISKGVLASKIELSINPRFKGNEGKCRSVKKTKTEKKDCRNDIGNNISSRRSIMVCRETPAKSFESSISEHMDPVFVNNYMGHF